MLTKLFLARSNVSASKWSLMCKFFSSTTSTSNVSNVSYFHQPGSQPLKFLTVGQLINQAALQYPNRQALISCHENTRITYSEALDKVDRLASGLLNLGLTKGDRVAVWASNFEFWYVSMFAIARAGMICVALNPAYQIPELDFCLKKVGVKAIIAPEAFRKQKHYDMLTTLLSNSDETRTLENVIIHSADKKLPGTIQFNDLMKSSSESDVAAIVKLQPFISPDAGCNIQFSSGTTGQPKAALLSHFQMVNNSHDIGVRHGLDETTRKICVNIPFFHVYGLIIGILNSMHHGSTLVLPAPHFSPEDSLRTIAKEKCDMIYGTPTMFVDLVAKQNELQIDLPEIEIANTGGAICTPKLVRDVETVLKVKKIRSIYGLTETTASVFQSMPNDENQKVQEFVGKVADHIEVKVVDKDGNAVPFGQPGELYVRGYSTMLGYCGEEKKTKETIGDDKWLKTGDQFVIYRNGYGKIVGRFKEMIVRGGENIFPREIEDFLNTHENILEAHVIGIPDERMGEEVGAFIRIKDKSRPLTRDDIKKFSLGKLSHFKIPRYIVIVEEFPRTVSGKIQKFRFLKDFESELNK